MSNAGALYCRIILLNDGNSPMGVWLVNVTDWRILPISSDECMCLAYSQPVKVTGRQTRWGRESTR